MNEMIDDLTAKRNIAINVLHHLDRRGWSNTKLADKFGESDMFVSKLVRGISMPGAAALKRVADSLDTSCDALMAQPSDAALCKFGARFMEKAS